MNIINILNKFYFILWTGERSVHSRSCIWWHVYFRFPAGYDRTMEWFILRDGVSRLGCGDHQPRRTMGFHVETQTHARYLLVPVVLASLLHWHI